MVVGHSRASSEPVCRHAHPFIVETLVAVVVVVATMMMEASTMPLAVEVAVVAVVQQPWQQQEGQEREQANRLSHPLAAGVR